ncbi:MAG: hypothetical protein SFW35_04170 [Chitinophagales bacterium]|nr:hypothetical protein [Chitinophagales bacterium]
MDFLRTLYGRNETLFWFGTANFLLGCLFMLLAATSHVKVSGVNAWYKPIKFALSIGIYAWTMAWYLHYLQPERFTWLNWTIVLALGFEILYIGIQAARGQLSHFNLSSPLYSSLYVMMALAASIVTLCTLYIGLLFFKEDIAGLPSAYLWGIRLGMVLFVIFSFEGFVMGSRLSHTIGHADGGKSLPFLNWSLQYGDPRVAHFIGMHALQIIPLLSFYVFTSVRATFVVSILYLLLAIYVLWLALQGKPFVKW